MMDYPNALDVAKSLLPYLEGWEISDTCRKRHYENDSIVHHHWAELTHPDHPGAEVTINTSHKSREKQLSITARYPEDWDLQERGRVFTESIHVSVSKTPGHIARDIQRRIFNEIHYLERVADCMARKVASERGYDVAEDVAVSLARIVGVRTAEQIQRDYHRSSGRDYDYIPRSKDDRLTFTVWPNTSGSRVEVKVSHGGKTVSVDLHNIPVDLARQILKLWHSTRAQSEGEDEA